MSQASLLASIDAFEALLDAMDDHRLLGFSRCHGWLAVDVVTHVGLGLGELLSGLTALTAAPPTHDAATYWEAFAGNAANDHVAHVVSTRRFAGGTERPSGIVRWLRPGLAGVRRAAAQADPAARVEFQEFVLTVEDFATIWAVEHAVHHLDVTAGDSLVPPPAASSLADARSTVEALLGRPVPVGWDDTDAALKGSGRVALDAADRDTLGADADRFPLLG
jgi:hypothetical protein